MTQRKVRRVKLVIAMPLFRTSTTPSLQRHSRSRKQFSVSARHQQLLDNDSKCLARLARTGPRRKKSDLAEFRDREAHSATNIIKPHPHRESLQRQLAVNSQSFSPCRQAIQLANDDFILDYRRFRLYFGLHTRQSLV